MKKHLVTIVALSMIICMIITSYFVTKNVTEEIKESPLFHFSTLEELFPAIDYEHDEFEFPVEEEEEEKEPEKPVKVDTPLEKEFRTLYTNYNEENTEILNDNFTTLTDTVIKLPEEHSDLLVTVTTNYVNKLFDEVSKDRDTIEEMTNATETPVETPTDTPSIDISIETPYEDVQQIINETQETLEDKFVEEEAAAFEELIYFVNDIVDEKDVETSAVYSMTETIAESEAMYETIMETAYTSTGDAITELYNQANDRTKSIIDKAVNDLEAAAKQYGIEEIGAAFKHLF